jgi:hypothetical protein
MNISKKINGTCLFESWKNVRTKTTEKSRREIWFAVELDKIDLICYDIKGGMIDEEQE